MGDANVPGDHRAGRPGVPLANHRRWLLRRGPGVEPALAGQLPEQYPPLLPQHGHLHVEERNLLDLLLELLHALEGRGHLLAYALQAWPARRLLAPLLLLLLLPLLALEDQPTRG